MLAETGEFQLVDLPGTTYHMFYESDLDALMEQEYAVNIVKRPARCLNPDCELGGGVHSVAVAIKEDLSMITTLAALPCPPDCPVKLVDPKIPGTMRFDDYIVITYMMCPTWMLFFIKMFGIPVIRKKRIRKS